MEHRQKSMGNELPWKSSPKLYQKYDFGGGIERKQRSNDFGKGWKQ